MTVTARESWTDERLDDLSAKVDSGFARVDQDIRELRSEMKAGFDSLHQTMIIGFVTILGSVAGALAVLGT